MSRQRRSFSAKFKSDLVIELLKGEKDLIPLQQKITSSQICCGTGKKSSLTMLPSCSMTSARKTSKKNLPKNGKRKRRMLKSRSVNHAGGLAQKKSEEIADLTTRVNLVQNLLTTKELPASVGARLLVLIVPAFIIKARLFLKKNWPAKRSLIICIQIIQPDSEIARAQLKARGYQVGRRKARRYMNEMDIYPIYPKMNLSKRMQQAKVCPYLLRNAVIDRPNQAWSIDITYVPIREGSCI